MLESGDQRPKRCDAAAKRRMVLANITANLASLLLSAAKDKPTRYNRKDWPQGIVSDTLDAMVEAGVIIRHRYASLRKQTTIEPKARVRMLPVEPTKKQRLIDALETLVLELERTGKDGPAAFFADTRGRVETECDGDRSRFLQLLIGLERSGAMTQYAGFSLREDALWEEVYEAATRWRESLDPTANLGRIH